MSGITVLGDKCTGHGSFPPRPSIEASSNVMVGGKGVVREGDAWDTHCNSKPSCHDGTVVMASKTVKVNGKGVVRIGDKLDCGSAVAKGSGTVKAGG